MSQLKNVEEIASRLRVKKSWVYQNAESGALPSIKVGRYLRFDPEEIEAWLRKKRSGK